MVLGNNTCYDRFVFERGIDLGEEGSGGVIGMDNKVLHMRLM